MRFKQGHLGHRRQTPEIGRGIVHYFLKEGARVASWRDAAKCAAVEAEAKAGGGEARFFPCDLSVEGEVARMIRAVSLWNWPAVVINNAGAGSRRGSVRDGDGPGARSNKLRGAILDPTIHFGYAMPLLREAGGGVIVNISSTATLHGNCRLLANRLLEIRFGILFARPYRFGGQHFLLCTPALRTDAVVKLAHGSS
jgi:NAD(P)-dependent dehydrogenase (short-subunit alcohol dehydrogenase family)